MNDERPITNASVEMHDGTKALWAVGRDDVTKIEASGVSVAGPARVRIWVYNQLIAEYTESYSLALIGERTQTSPTRNDNDGVSNGF